MFSNRNAILAAVTPLAATAALALGLVVLSGGIANADHKPGHGVGSGGEEIQNQLNALQAQIDNLGTIQEDLLILLEPRVIFTTSTTHTGNLGGLQGADDICQDLADGPESIVPEGEYLALLSTSTVSAVQRFTPTLGLYIRPDGVAVSTSAALFSVRNGHTLLAARSLLNSPRFNEKGLSNGIGPTWTGSFFTGGSSGFNCLDWTSESDQELGRAGAFGSIGEAWLDASTPTGEPCDGAPFGKRVYCVQQ